MPAKKISLDNAKRDKLFYFVVNVVVYREEDGRCLLLKRSENEKVHPGKWCVPGGKLEWGNLDFQNPTRLNGDVLDFDGVVEDLLVREAREEAGIEIERDLKYFFNAAFIRPDEIPVVFFKFATRYKGGNVHLEEGSFSDFAWVTAEEAKKYPCIERIPLDIAEGVAALGK